MPKIWERPTHPIIETDDLPPYGRLPSGDLTSSARYLKVRDK